MKDSTIIALFFLIAGGFFTMGMAFSARANVIIKIKLIRMEHRLARLEQREPRNIEILLQHND